MESNVAVKHLDLQQIRVKYGINITDIVHKFYEKSTVSV